jgi:hypothetical protein
LPRSRWNSESKYSKDKQLEAIQDCVELRFIASRSANAQVLGFSRGDFGSVPEYRELSASPYVAELDPALHIFALLESFRQILTGLDTLFSLRNLEDLENHDELR